MTLSFDEIATELMAAEREIATLRERVGELEGVLRQGAEWFREYSDHHAAKWNAMEPGEERDAVKDKAFRNYERFVFLSATLQEKEHD